MIVSEEAIAKGIRRIVAVTGAEAQKVSRSGWFVAYLNKASGAQSVVPQCRWSRGRCGQNRRYSTPSRVSSRYPAWRKKASTARNVLTILHLIF